jgi:hypothetical protein
MAGSVEPYRSHWTRKETGHEDMAYMRRILAIHMDIARETGLVPVLRARVLDLASQILDSCLAPTNWLGLAEMWKGSQDLKAQNAVKEVARTHSIEPVAELLAKLADKWGFGPMEWPFGEDRAGSPEAFGTAHVGEALVRVPIRFYNFGATHWEAPSILGPWQQAVALLPRLRKLVGAKDDTPAKIWPKGKTSWEPLDEWFIPEEIESTRREIERLRALPPAETTTGRGANAAPIAELAARFEVKEDTAAVLAACVAGALAPDKDNVAAWAGVKRDNVHDHMKKLEKAGAVAKLGKELRLAVPHEGLRYENDDDQVAVFKRLFWNRYQGSSSDLDGYRTKTARRFLEEDILREYLKHV